jgi:hypothetical protein
MVPRSSTVFHPSRPRSAQPRPCSDLVIACEPIFLESVKTVSSVDDDSDGPRHVHHRVVREKPQGLIEIRGAERLVAATHQLYQVGGCGLLRHRLLLSWCAVGRRLAKRGADPIVLRAGIEVGDELDERAVPAISPAIRRSCRDRPRQLRLIAAHENERGAGASFGEDLVSSVLLCSDGSLVCPHGVDAAFGAFQRREHAHETHDHDIETRMIDATTPLAIRTLD